MSLPGSFRLPVDGFTIALVCAVAIAPLFRFEVLLPPPYAGRRRKFSPRSFALGFVSPDSEAKLLQSGG